MKKPILIMASVLATLGSFAQTTKVDSAKSLKPNAKSFTTELNVNPFNGQVNFNNSLNQIKLRYFTTPSFALRLGFNVSRIDSINNVNNPYGVNSYFSNNERKSSTVGVNLGIEKHLVGTKRLSPYLGADLSITDKSSSQNISDNQSTTTVTNAWYYSYYSNNTLITQTPENGYTRYGLNLFAGFDFYIARHFFFGYEFNYSITKTNWKNVTVTTTTTTTNPSTNNNSTNTSTKNSAMTFGPSLMNGIRLGYSF
jgi:hypothetical protein